ncbi:Maltose/maltodextrin import ATP-binding protein MalK [Stieleria neptunia]|uniref:Maltose/maltodextrin import ATP-binding protein MalK n=1 Tax=Stieleria neptunia TaxID=2527979 RepID=A0A518HR41_9BACT|nr:ABC transporter ATP-binding protein [Stieleria neptunia]QDV43287.1 Maltose/maltodextrin import ATP-binding protein MalK [Stieleria neptunia]
MVDCMQVVQLNNISLRYDHDNVMDEISVSVHEGEYVVILGASGCGKTSLLRMIAGLIAPTSGTIFLSGRDVTRVAPRHRDVALVPQQAGVYPHWPIGRSIGMGVRGRLSRADREQRIREAAQMVDLESLLDRLPEQLSGGQLRRAAVAKAIASRASVRLLDEPLSAIDANLRFQIEKDLLRLHHQSPGVTLHVTHDGAEAMRLASRVAVIEDGRIAQFDTPEQLRTRPATPGVASALGRSALITIPVTQIDGAWVSEDGRRVGGPDAATGSSAVLGYYEEDLQPLEKAESGEGSAIAGRWFDHQRNATVDHDRIFWFVG